MGEILFLILPIAAFLLMMFWDSIDCYIHRWLDIREAKALGEKKEQRRIDKQQKRFEKGQYKSVVEGEKPGD